MTEQVMERWLTSGWSCHEPRHGSFAAIGERYWGLSSESVMQLNPALGLSRSELSLDGGRQPQGDCILMYKS